MRELYCTNEFVRSALLSLCQHYLHRHLLAFAQAAAVNTAKNPPCYNSYMHITSGGMTSAFVNLNRVRDHKLFLPITKSNMFVFFFFFSRSSLSLSLFLFLFFIYYY